MMQYKMTFVLSCAISAMAAFGVVDGYIVPLASNPTNVKTRSWDLPGIFGKVTIPGATISDTLRYSFVGDDNGRGNTFYSPLQPVDPSQQEASEEQERGRRGSALELQNIRRVSEATPETLANTDWQLKKYNHQ